MLLSMLFAAMLAPAAEERRPGGQPEAIVYRDAGYSGPAVAVGRANPDMGLAWPVRSIRVNSGTWQLCPQRNYGGRCITVSRSTSNLGNQLGPGSRLVSIRPIGAEPPRPVPNQSLRGMAAEFFPRPVRDGRRVAACATGSATANCAARSADAFCRAQGWNGSKSEALESEGRAVYLADVLCVRSGY
ncbi:hypothetical protein G432_08015 [Sphingomonas sp. MM-1]|uniref:beta/gamma crystallin-related protein n=1 Tax=Sphingomonas sp. MM-1 TaxID=745310 RepID=UPI0002C07871|nr:MULTISPECIES: beta/gamma crystallin-related protein [unclassified Sphingomonas]AGH49328.1 hypothetical protein G432_08015 [Sphingomonas sp. MM-1]MDX3885883.1 beta/gamma crystallin-related protein [Sphingomonas sp.]